MPQIRVHLSADNHSVHELAEEIITLGRVEDNVIQIEDASVSSHHAEISHRGGGEYFLQDKGSTNGTFVNGSPVTDAVLKSGDQIRFGSIDAVFTADAPAATGTAQPPPQAERAAASLGGASARPAGFLNASPFPKPKEKNDGLTIAAVALAALGAIAAVAAVVLSVSLQAPAI